MLWNRGFGCSGRLLVGMFWFGTCEVHGDLCPLCLTTQVSITPSMLCQGGLRQWRDGHRAGRVEWNRWTKPRYSWNRMLNVVAQGFALNPNSDTWSGSYSTGWRRWKDNFERCNQGSFRKEVRIFSLSLFCTGFIEIWIYGFSIFARKSVERESDTIQRFSSMRSPRTRLLINSKRCQSTPKGVNQQQKILNNSKRF